MIYESFSCQLRGDFSIIIQTPIRKFIEKLVQHPEKFRLKYIKFQVTRIRDHYFFCSLQGDVVFSQYLSK